MKEKVLLVVKSIAVLIIIALICILFTHKCGQKDVEEIYSITFNSNGGTELASQKVEKNDKVIKPEDPVKDGYTFIGWYVGEEPYNFDSKVTKDLEIVAKWEEVVIINVTGVAVDQTAVALLPGGTTQLVAIIEPTNAKDQTVTWTSSNESIVTVDENGLVTAIKEGKATVKVITTDGGYMATVNVTVSSNVVSVESITLNKTSMNLPTNSSAMLKATIKPNNASNKGIIWSSSNNKIATVDVNGKVVGKSAGTVTITATTKDGGHKATCTVTVSDIKVTGIKLSNSSLTMNLGTTKTVTATVKPDNASNKTVTWKSDNTSVATVDANGKITAKNEGTATITATTKDGGHKATCVVTVNRVKVTGVFLSASTATMYVGDTKTITATIAPSNATNKNVTWKSDNTSVATVTSSGKITAVKAGTAKIVVTTEDGSYNKTVDVTVKEKVAATDVKISGNTSGTEGGTIQLSATITPSDTYDKTITWKSDNTTVATVSSSGKVTLKSPGTVKITATAKSGVSATHTITVKEKAANYVVKFTPIVQEGTGAINQYSFTVTKNGASFSDYSFIIFNGSKVNKGSYLSAAKYNTSVTSATIRLSNGDDVTATVK